MSTVRAAPAAAGAAAGGARRTRSCCRRRRSCSAATCPTSGSPRCRRCPGSARWPTCWPARPTRSPTSPARSSWSRRWPWSSARCWPPARRTAARWPSSAGSSCATWPAPGTGCGAPRRPSGCASWPAARIRTRCGRWWPRRGSGSAGPTDDDFGAVRIGVGSRQLATPLVPSQSGPVEDLDPLSATALRRFITTHRAVPELPLTVLLRRFSALGISADPGPTRTRPARWSGPCSARPRCSTRRPS